VRIEFEGQPLSARGGDTVAAALLADGHWQFRTTPVSGAARGPFCMMGVCFDCLVEIDGVANRQACMVEVREGMRVRRQRGAVDLGADDSAIDDHGGAP
jgi:predicted molibdopterin-dependent oxidoreductase YjgC